MSTYETQRQESGGSIDDLHHLDVKALTTPMTVLEEGPDVWLVQHNYEHTVARVDGVLHCDCKGYQYWHECYHLRRLRFELGEREVPEWVDESAIDEAFREFVTPVATDGGQLFREGRDRQRVPVAGGVLVYEQRDIDRELVGFRDGECKCNGGWE